MTVGGGGKPYTNLPGFQGYGHSQMDLVIAEDCASNHPDLPAGMFGNDNAIYIEGDSKYIKQALLDALHVIEMLDSYNKKLGEIRPTNCPDGCTDIDHYNGNHALTCPKHPNYEYFKKKE